MRLITHALMVGIATLLLTFTGQAEPISPQDAYSNVGALTTVQGVVSQVSTTNSGTTFINFGGQYPNHVFYGIIFRNDADQFAGAHRLEGRTVLIHGTIDLYKGKPQIILRDPDQIRVME